ncbi:DNA-binding protein [Xylanibacillus composti]|uniref:UPF0122 protein XYCOK13_14990 n=1 Tax=Xylanibacillus composti TaxID=1572762 RepID=A0A8J4M221_9BACL|nr:YlxM family DNA-binding protein [Xylanibacillus composti]MDT9724125.1 DNA-binding protein [Xylanibacillus composti]GIQ68675.1 hypothetical protein XYCOK13_14990 [Xylanibacillus composti]
MDRNALEKTNRINLLYDFYRMLLTDKQQMFMQYYFHEDYSLGEIANLFAISRQAVYEHIKRAETTLEDYEGKLGLVARHERRALLMEETIEHLDRLSDALEALPETDPGRASLLRLRQIAEELIGMDDDSSEGGDSHGV